MKLIFPITFFFSLLSNIDAAGQQIKYAARVTAWSSQYYPSGGYSSEQAAGAPNTAGCGDASSAWCPSTPDGRREFLELEYDNPVPINRIIVYENAGTGAVDTIYVMNPATQQWVKVFETTARSVPECPRTLITVFPMTDFPVSKVRIAVNSPAVSSWNEIDAVGVAAFSSGGAIGADQTVCASTRAAAFTNIDFAFDGAPGVVYQWQDSTENGSWQFVNGAGAAVFHAPVVTENTWYRRSAVLNGATVYSNTVKLTVIQNGDPSVFPLNQWNFYCYQSSNIDLNAATYKGFYSRSPVNFNMSADWHYNRSPGAGTTGYQGCEVPVDFFVVAARRKGFPAGSYVLNFPSFSSAARVYLNGTLLRDMACCSGTVSVGALDENSELEIRLLDGGGQAYLAVEFNIAPLNGGDIGESQQICTGNLPSNIISNIDAYGGAVPASITYQWQDSVVNGAWTNIANATNKTYQAGALQVTTWYRRKASDNTGATAYSDVVRIGVGTIQGDTTVYGNQSWNVYAFNGSDITLTTNSYRGYYTITGLTVNTSNSFPTYLSPSAAANYTGCPVDNDNFVISARRHGFPAGNYKLDITNADDHLILLVNGIEVYSGRTGNIRVGLLDENTKVEIRLLETNNSAFLDAKFVRIENSVADYTNFNCNFYYLHFVNQDGWYDFTDPSGKLVLSFHPNGNDLGTMELYTKHFGTGTANIPSAGTRKFLPRNFKLRSFNYPTGNFPNPVKVRLYFKNSEFEDYKIAVNKPALLLNDLALAHYKGNSEDCEFHNNQNPGVELPSPVVGDIAGTGFYLEASTNNFSEFSVLESAEPLPVSLTSFSAKLMMDKVALNWSTAQELDNKGFEILRSADGRNFVKIGWIDGNGNSHSAIKYSFTDASPLAGKNFYRLRQVDIDGNSTHSEIVAVSTGNNTKLSLSPNPVNNILYIEYDVRNTSQLSIMDLQGRVLWKQHGQGTSSLLAVPVQPLSKGVYLLEVVDKQGKRQIQKFVKQ